MKNTTYILRIIGIDNNNNDYLGEDITNKIGSKQYISSSCLTTLDTAFKFDDLNKVIKLSELLNGRKLLLIGSLKEDAHDIKCVIKKVVETADITDITDADINKLKIEENNNQIRKLQEQNSLLSGTAVKSNGFFTQKEMNNLFNPSNEESVLKNDENSLRDAREIEFDVATISDLIKYASNAFKQK